LEISRSGLKMFPSIVFHLQGWILSQLSVSGAQSLV